MSSSSDAQSTVPRSSAGAPREPGAAYVKDQVVIENNNTLNGDSPGSDVENKFYSRQGNNMNPAGGRRPVGTLAPEGVGGQGGSYLHGSVQSPADSETSVAHLISSDSDSEDEDNGDNNDSGDEEGTLSNEDYARSGRRRNSRRDRKNGKVDDEDDAPAGVSSGRNRRRHPHGTSGGTTSGGGTSSSRNHGMAQGGPAPGSGGGKPPSTTPPKIKRHGQNNIMGLTLGGPTNLMVSPEVLGRLRRVQEKEDEGRYSQSSASEYMSGWGGETDETATTDDSSAGEEEEVRSAPQPEKGVHLNRGGKLVRKTSQASSSSSATTPEGPRPSPKKSGASSPSVFDAAQEVAWAAWSTCLTDDGVAYYYNGATGESQWESPFPTPPRSAPEKRTQRPSSSLSNVSAKGPNGTEGAGRVKNDDDEFRTPKSHFPKPNLKIRTHGLNGDAGKSGKKSAHNNRNVMTPSTSASPGGDLGTAPAVRRVSVDAPLHGAVSYNYQGDEHVQQLLRDGADPNAPDAKAGRTALHIAAAQGYFAGMEMLFEAGADPLTLDNEGNTVMHHACKGGNGKYSVDVASYLRTMGSSLDVQNREGNSPLHLAATVGDLSCVQYLLEFGANPGTRNSGGETPAHVAAGNGHASCIVQLAEYGAILDTKTNSGSTVHDVAVKAGKKWCAERVALLPARMLPDQIRRPVVQATKVPPSVHSPLLSASNAGGNVSHLISSDSDSEAAGSSSGSPRKSVLASTPLASLGSISAQPGSSVFTPNPYSPVRGGKVERDVYEALVAESMGMTDENKELKTRLVVVEEELDRVRRELRDKNAQFTKVQAQAQTQEADIKKLSAEKSKLTEQFVALESKSKATEDALMGSINSLRMELRSFEVINASQKKQLNEVRASSRMSEQQVHGLSMQLEAKANKEHTLETSLASVEDAMKTQTIQYAAALEQYERRLSVTLSKNEDSDTRILQLEAALAAAKSELENQSSSIHYAYGDGEVEHGGLPSEHPDNVESVPADKPVAHEAAAAPEESEGSVSPEAPAEQGFIETASVPAPTNDSRKADTVQNEHLTETYQEVASHGTAGILPSSTAYAVDGRVDGNARATYLAHENRTPHGSGLPEEKPVESVAENAPPAYAGTVLEDVPPVGGIPVPDNPPSAEQIERIPHSVPPELQGQNSSDSSTYSGDTARVAGVASAQYQPLRLEASVESRQQPWYGAQGESGVPPEASYAEGGEVDINMWSAWGHNSSPWVGYTSEEGAVYYYNTETGESSWEPPKGVPPIANSVGEEGVAHQSNLHSGQHFGHAVESRKTNNGYVPPSTPTLPEETYMGEQAAAQNVADDKVEAPSSLSKSEGPIETSVDPDTPEEGSSENKPTSPQRVANVWERFFENAALNSLGEQMKKTSPIASPRKQELTVPPAPQQKYAVHQACKERDLELLSVLYSQGAADGGDVDIDEVNKAGDTPLHISTRAGDESCVRFLLESAASVDVTDRLGNSPLHIAVGLENIKLVKLLADYGANYDLQNKNKETSLDIAFTKATESSNPSAQLIQLMDFLRRRGGSEYMDEDLSQNEYTTESSSDEFSESGRLSSGTGRSDSPYVSDNGSGNNTPGSNEDSWKFWGMISTVGAFFGKDKPDGAHNNAAADADLGAADENQKAVVANLGRENKFVYDEKSKMWVNSKSSSNESSPEAVSSPVTPTKKDRRRPSALVLPPTDADLGPTPPPSVSPRSKSRSGSPSFKSVMYPSPEVALALAMGKSKSPGSPSGSPRSSSSTLRKPPSIVPKKLNLSDSGKSAREPLPAKLSRSVSLDEGTAQHAKNGGKNRFSISSRRGGPTSMRLRYVNTFQAPGGASGAEEKK